MAIHPNFSVRQSPQIETQIFEPANHAVKFGRSSIRTMAPQHASHNCSQCGANPAGGIFYALCSNCKGISNDPRIDRHEQYCYNCVRDQFYCECDTVNDSPPTNKANEKQPAPIEKKKNNEASQNATPIPIDQCCCCHAPCCTCSYICELRCCCLHCKCHTHACANCCSLSCIKPTRDFSGKSEKRKRRPR